MAKSVSDASWSRLSELLVYKAVTHGIELKLKVNEAYSTQTCHVCGERTGPKGFEGLKVRNWVCSECGSGHDREQNGAINIFIKGFGRRPEGIFVQKNEQTNRFGSDWCCSGCSFARSSFASG